MSLYKYAMLDGIVRKDMRKEFASIRNEYALYHRELESHPPKRKLSTKDRIILDFLKENECGDLIFTPLPKSSSQVINYNKESGKFSFDITSNIHGAGKFPFFESLDHILLPYLLESVQQYLVWCEGDEIIHLDKKDNPTDDMSLDSKEFNEITVWTDLTDMLQNNIKNRSWETTTYYNLWDWGYDYYNGIYPVPGSQKYVRLLEHYDCETGETTYTKI